MKDELSQRIELLQRKVNELMEQQQAIEKQIKAYKDLIRHYRAVYEAEHGLGVQGTLSPEIAEAIEQTITESTKVKKRYKSIPDAVLEVLSETDDALHASEIGKIIVQKYPTIQDRVKDINKRVVVALVRGVQQGLFERVGRNIYRLKPAPTEERKT